MNHHGKINKETAFDPMYFPEGEEKNALEKELKAQWEAFQRKSTQEVTVELVPDSMLVTDSIPAENTLSVPHPALPQAGTQQQMILASNESSQLTLSQRFMQYNGIALPPQCTAPAPPAPPGNAYPYIPARGGSNPRPVDLLEILKQKYIIRVKDQDVHFYNGRHYHKTNRQTVERLIMDTCKAEVIQSGSASIVKKTYDLLLIDPELAIMDMSADRDLLGFQNGVLRLSDGRFLGHSPNLFVTYVLDCNYLIPPCKITCPNFDRYLFSATQGNPELMERILQVIGYCLTPDTAAKAFFVLQGVANSGKSLLTECLLRSIFPPDKVVSMDIHDLSSRFSLGNLADMALCLSADLPAKPLDAISASHIKKITGSDMVSADKKYGSRQQFRFDGKLVMATNYPLLTATPDPAFLQRAVCIPFLHGVSPEERDESLKETIPSERAVIVSRAMEAYFRLRRNHYRFAGNFALNAPALFVGCEMDAMADVSVQMAVFLQRFFEPDADGLVGIEEACNLFAAHFSTMTSSRFSAKFTPMAMQTYDCMHVRARLNGEKNPRSCLKGIRLKAIDM